MPKNPRKTLSIIFYEMSTIQFFCYNLYKGNNNLNRAIRSSFFIGQPVESKNEQNTRNKLKLELTLYETKTHKVFP